LTVANINKYFKNYDALVNNDKPNVTY
jgi:hypothetical protein